MGTSPRQAAVDAARDLLYARDGRSETELAEVVVARVSEVLAGDLFIDEVGVRDGQGRLHLVRDDTTDQLWALLEAILPTRDAGGGVMFRRRRRNPAQDIPETIRAHYTLPDGTRVETEARLMGTTDDGYLRYVLPVSADAVGAGMEMLPGMASMEVVGEE